VPNPAPGSAQRWHHCSLSDPIRCRRGNTWRQASKRFCQGFWWEPEWASNKYHSEPVREALDPCPEERQRRQAQCQSQVEVAGRQEANVRGAVFAALDRAWAGTPVNAAEKPALRLVRTGPAWRPFCGGRAELGSPGRAAKSLPGLPCCFTPLWRKTLCLAPSQQAAGPAHRRAR